MEDSKESTVNPYEAELDRMFDGLKGGSPADTMAALTASLKLAAQGIKAQITRDVDRSAVGAIEMALVQAGLAGTWIRIEMTGVDEAEIMMEPYERVSLGWLRATAIALGTMAITVHHAERVDPDIRCAGCGSDVCLGAKEGTESHDWLIVKASGISISLRSPLRP